MKRIRVWTTASVTTSLAVGLTLVGNVATGGRLLPWSSPVWLLLILIVLGLVITTARQSRQNDSERIDEFRSEALAAPRGHAPPLTTTFVGRQREAATLRQAIENNGQVTVIGLGGVGKTQLVCEYLRKYRARYRFVWWIRADHQEVLAGDFDAIAIGLNLPAPRESVRTSVMAWLERNNDWLLVFDDVRDGVAVQSFIPSTAGGHIILTSRSRFGLPGCHVELTDWTPEQSAEFLRNSLRESQAGDDALSEIATVLCHVPLSLDQARSYLLATGISAESYLVLLRGNVAAMLRAGRAFGRADTVATTFQISIKSAEREVRGTRGLLELCSLYAGTRIPRNLPRTLSETKGTTLAAVALLRRRSRDDLRYNAMIAALARQSLLDADSEYIYIHGLVQSAVKASMGTRRRQAWTFCAASSVYWFLRSGDNNSTEFRGQLAELLMPHVLVVAEQAEHNVPKHWPFRHNWPTWIAWRECALSLSLIAMHLSQRGDIVDGERAATRALHLAEESLGWVAAFEGQDRVPSLLAVCYAVEAYALFAALRGQFADAEAKLDRALTSMTRFRFTYVLQSRFSGV